MNLRDAQREMRFAFLGGFAGQLVSGLVWLIAAAVSVWVQPGYGMAALFFGSMLIFPLTQVLLRLMRPVAKVTPQNGLWGLGSQIAFTVPINFLVVVAATYCRENWFFPAGMIVVGAHYLPFVTLYGMRLFAALAAVLVFAGVSIAVFGPDIFSLGGWFTGVTLILFALIGRMSVKRETIEKDIASMN